MAEPLEYLDNPIDVPWRISQLFKEIQLQIDGDFRYSFIRCGRDTLINLSYIRKIDCAQRSIRLSDGINHYDVHVSLEACVGVMTRMEQCFNG